MARVQWLAQVHPEDRPQVLAALDDALRARKARRGIAAICIGGGLGGAMLVEGIE